MSIKILLISSDEELFHNIENVFQSHIERGFFVIYSPKHIENSPVKIIYDVIITEEKYLSLIPLKHLPIIILNSTGANIKNDEPNLIYTENPMKLEDLYDIILSLQYRFSSNNLSIINEPIIKNYTNPLEETSINLPDILKLNEVDTYTTENNTININKNEIVDISPPKVEIFQNTIEKEIINNNIKSNYKNDYIKENHELTSKFYNLEDLKKITKILHSYGEENKVEDKIIAQASIILDELLYTIQNLEGINNNLNNKEPKLFMTIKNYNKEFQMNIECLVPLEDKIQNVIGIAQDYGNMVQSFKKNNSYYLNINWYL